MWHSLLLSWLLATAGVSSGGIVTAWGGAWLLPQGMAKPLFIQPFLIPPVRNCGAAIADWPLQPFDPFFNVNDPIDLQTAETILLSRKNAIA